jgi:hypothetical protein
MMKILPTMTITSRTNRAAQTMCILVLLSGQMSLRKSMAATAVASPAATLFFSHARRYFIRLLSDCLVASRRRRFWSRSRSQRASRRFHQSPREPCIRNPYWCSFRIGYFLGWSRMPTGRQSDLCPGNSAQKAGLPLTLPSGLPQVGGLGWRLSSSDNFMLRSFQLSVLVP